MFFTYLRRELRRRRKAALVVASGLALGIALVIVVNSVSAGMSRAQGEVLQSLYGLGTDMTVTKAQSPQGEGGSAGRPRFKFDARGEGDADADAQQSRDLVMPQGFQTLDSATVAKVAGQDGVARAVGGLSLQVMKVNGQFKRGEFRRGQGGGGAAGGTAGKPGAGGAGGGNTVEGGGADFDVNSFSVYGTDVTRPELGPLTTSKITSGRGFAAGDKDAAVTVVDSAYAKKNNLAVGSELTVKNTPFKVLGIATADSGDATANLYVPLHQAQTLAETPDKITTVYVQARDSQAIGSVKRAIQKNVPDTTVTTSADLADTVSGSLSTAASLASTVGTWLSYLVLAAAFLVAGLLTSSAVSRRVREFGTLKALGWKSSRVTLQVVGEALVNGLIGGVLGIGVGLGAAYAITAAGPTLTARLAGAAGRAGMRAGGQGGFGGMRAARQSAGKALDVALTAPVSPSVIGLAVALAVAGGLIAGGFGGWRASRLRPADALRRVE
ncbi:MULTISPECIES: ABC transporter permease [unclassified Streptomyces]|uniref:ABC transporter permease n=1 Tax=unclassified Streptomyces TaxID=2593676 RepID=UPI002E37666B|nr:MULTISPECIES: ABC transporter permease [unclassified Streptomyces]WUC64919.1 ABC transporter permease [Streptomyces sp. NBC_00539]